jgi:hypothetical protein
VGRSWALIVLCDVITDQWEDHAARVKNPTYVYTFFPVPTFYDCNIIDLRTFLKSFKASSSGSAVWGIGLETLDAEIVGSNSTRKVCGYLSSYFLVDHSSKGILQRV